MRNRGENVTGIVSRTSGAATSTVPGAVPGLHVLMALVRNQDGGIEPGSADVESGLPSQCIAALAVGTIPTGAV